MVISLTYINSDPIIDFHVKNVKGMWTRFLAYVDSGAALTILTREDAYRLGINLTRGKSIDLHGISGAIPAYTHNCQIKIADRILKVKIAFSTSNETPRLIGREGIFDKFEVCFNDKKKIVNFSNI